MNCRRAKALISPWLDGELNDGTTQALAGHLERCAECRRAADAMRAVRANVQALAQIAPSPDFDSRVRSMIEARIASPRRFWLADLANATAELIPRYATAVFVAAALAASLYWAAQAPARAIGQPATPFDEIRRRIDSLTFTAPVALIEPEDWQSPFWRYHDG